MGRRKLTHAEQVAAIAKVNPNVEVLEEIKGSLMKVLCRCKVCSHEWKARVSDLKNSKGCPECAVNRRKLTHAEHVADIAKSNPNIEILGKIINAITKVSCRCKVCGHKWDARPADLKKGKGCPECKKIKISAAQRLTHAEHVAIINKVNPNVEILGEITGNAIKVLCRCRICGHEWEVRPGNLKSGRGCPECGKIKSDNAKRLTHTEHVADIAKNNPDVEVLGKITGCDKKVSCRCKVCGHEWRVTPHSLKHGYGCPECNKIKIRDRFRKTHAKHVAEIAAKNPGVEIIGEITKVTDKVLTRCRICGHEWMARPDNLKSGRGCPKCVKIGFLSHDVGKLYIMVDDLNVPTMMKIGVSVREDERSKRVVGDARRAGVIIPALHVAKTWEGPTELMMRIEQMMHENYEEWNIKFPTKFDGYKEFFYYTHETAGVFDAVNEIYYTVVNQF